MPDGAGSGLGDVVTLLTVSLLALLVACLRLAPANLALPILAQTCLRGGHACLGTVCMRGQALIICLRRLR